MSKKRRGFTLIEVIIDAFIITVVFGALIGSFIFVLRTVASSQLRAGALALANEQMETLRNLPYDSLSTQNGTILPHGTIPDSQTTTSSGRTYYLSTSIIYVDDPFDGCAIPAGSNLYECTDGQTSTTQDIIPMDYKRISIEVREAADGVLLASLSSNVAAKAAETSSNTGMLLVIINDANGRALAGATVTITNTALGISVSGMTNSRGQLFVAGLTPDNHNRYHIVATKNGFSTDFTTPRTPQNPNQSQPDVDINAQQVTIQTLSIDLLAQMRVTVRSEVGTPLTNLAITATSSKTTQFNPVVPKNVYQVNSDSSGVALFPAVEWDSYTITSPAGYLVIVTDPYQEVSVDPTSLREVSFVITQLTNWPRITSIAPTGGSSGATVEIVIEGSDFPGNTTVLLRKNGSADILPASFSVAPNEKSIDATFNLMGAALGSWDIVVQSGSQVTIQTNGFIIS